jgi:hypothetical protein
LGLEIAHDDSQDSQTAEKRIRGGTGDQSLEIVAQPADYEAADQNIAYMLSMRACTIFVHKIGTGTATKLPE